VSVLLCCDVFFPVGVGIFQGCVCGVPGLVMVVWFGRLCFEGICVLCGSVESSV